MSCVDPCVQVIDENQVRREKEMAHQCLPFLTIISGHPDASSQESPATHLVRQLRSLRDALDFSTAIFLCGDIAKCLAKHAYAVDWPSAAHADASEEDAEKADIIKRAVVDLARMAVDRNVELILPQDVSCEYTGKGEEGEGEESAAEEDKGEAAAEVPAYNLGEVRTFAVPPHSLEASYEPSGEEQQADMLALDEDAAAPADVEQPQQEEDNTAEDSNHEEGETQQEAQEAAAPSLHPVVPARDEWVFRDVGPLTVQMLAAKMRKCRGVMWMGGGLGADDKATKKLIRHMEQLTHP